MKCSHCDNPAQLKPSGKSTGYCKKCKKKYGQEHYNKNKETYLQRARIARQATIEEVRKRKAVPCKDCNIAHPYWKMQFDHLDGATKTASVAVLLHTSGLKKILKEIEKCEVVCANCHADRTQARLIAARVRFLDGPLTEASGPTPDATL